MSRGRDPARLLRASAAALLCAWLGACAATTGEPGPADGAASSAEPAPPRDGLLHVDDPLQGLNQRIYKFNAQADRYVLLPIVRAYELVVPLVLRDRVTDFFSNIGDLQNFANLVLQLKFKRAFETVMRFGANTTLGMFGLVDIATPMGLPKYNEDFGQTLGYWGMGGGPYLVLPILGPSNARDTAGTATDRVAFAVVDPFGIASLESDHPEILATEAVDSRYTQSFRYHESGSPFEYLLVRYLYTKKRQVEIGDIPVPDGEGTKDDLPSN